MSIPTNGAPTPGKSTEIESVTTPGRATAEATSLFRERHSDFSQSFRILGSTGLITSGVGFGTYRVDVRVPSHRAALAAAVRKGVNLIDTSANYADGNSERLIGDVIRGLVEHSVAKREEIIVVSKGGYIQGENFKRMKARVEAPDPDLSPGSELAELTQYGQGLWHSIHPDFLKDQITRSLERLKLETIDVYLLHNPEYYIQWAVKDNIPEDEARAEYERRIKQAFAYLEEEVKLGRIGWYGISSNTFPKPEESVDRTSLERALRSAEQIWREQRLERHHFAVIQLPFNLFEHGAITEQNQVRATKTVIEFARENNIGVLINRPLNAIVGGQLRRLADFPEREVPPGEDIDDMIHDLALQEKEFKGELLPKLPLNNQQSDAIKKLMTIGELLDKQWRGFNSMEEWQEASATVLAPRVQYCFDVLRPLSRNHKELYDFLVNYAEAADLVFEHITNYYSNEAYTRSVALHNALDTMMPEEYHALSLSQKAILLIRSVEGVSSVLVGMRSEEYVDDVVYGLYAKPMEDTEKMWVKLANLQS